MSRFECFAVSEQGPENDVNDDFCAVDPECGVFVVADGMGGRSGGARASRLATQVVMQQMKSLDASARLSESRLKAVVSLANEAIRSVAASDPSLDGMGTTLSAVVLNGAGGKVVHVGDSRVYLYRHGRLSQLTKDHTLVAELVERQHLPPRDATDHPLRHMLSRFLGSEECPEPEIQDVALTMGDWLLLVTDGVTKSLRQETLERVVAESSAAGAEQLCRELICAVRKKPPADDVTVAVVRLQPKDSRARISGVRRSGVPRQE